MTPRRETAPGETPAPLPPASGRWSLKRRLAIRLAIVLTLGVLGPAMVMIGAAMIAINSMDDRALQDQASDIANALDTSTTPARLRLPDNLAAAYVNSGDAYLYLVAGPDRSVLAASSPVAAAALDSALGSEDDRFFAVPRPDGGVPWYGYATSKGTYRILVAQGDLHDDTLADSVIRELVNFSLVTAVPLLVLTLIVAMWTLNRAFRELDRVAEQAHAIQPDSSGGRLSPDGLPDEIRPLVAAVNDALARLGRAYDVERRFTTDAAHELRTPVAVLTARIDTMPPGPLKSELASDATRLSRLVSQMLDVARLDAAPLPMDASVDLVALAREALAALGPLAVRQHRTLQLAAPSTPVKVAGNANALQLALTNLVENAMLHTPEGTPIDIEITGEPAIRVLDRGPGVPEEERAMIFERFQRGRAMTSPGTGLGLAIVDEIAVRHGAEAAVTPRPGGGSVFSIIWNEPAAR